MMSITSGIVYVRFTGLMKVNVPVGLLEPMISLPVLFASQVKTSFHGLPSMLKA